MKNHVMGATIDVYKRQAEGNKHRDGHIHEAEHGHHPHAAKVFPAPHTIASISSVSAVVKLMHKSTITISTRLMALPRL